MAKYEYAEIDRDAHTPMSIDELNSQGAIGWDFVSVVYKPPRASLGIGGEGNDGVPGSFAYYFKRELSAAFRGELSGETRKEIPAK